MRCLNPSCSRKGTAASAVSYHPSKAKLQNVIKRKAANVFNLAKSLTYKKPKIIIETKFFQAIETAKIKYKQRLSSTDILNFQQLRRYQFPSINGLVLCPTSCLDPRPFNNSIFVHLLDYNKPDGKNHWVLFSNIGKIYCWSVYDSVGIASKEYKSFFKSILHNEKQVSIERPSCTKQKESWTCGLFCLAFATALVWVMTQLNIHVMKTHWSTGIMIALQILKSKCSLKKFN